MRRQPRGLYCLNILYGALLMLNIPCPTWQNTQPQHPNVAITVFRGTRGDSDRVYICPTKTDTELDSRYIESKTMNCSNAKEEVCDQNGGASCVCQGNNPIYIVNRRRCVNNVWLRQGKHRYTLYLGPENTIRFLLICICRHYTVENHGCHFSKVQHIHLRQT
jgi:hypothetical protein